MQWYSNDAQISLLCTQLETEVQVVESTPSFCAECCHQRAAFANVEEEEKEEETGYIYVYQSEVLYSPFSFLYPPPSCFGLCYVYMYMYT